MDIKLRNLDLAGRIVNLDQPAPASLCLSRPHPDDCAYAGQRLADPTEDAPTSGRETICTGLRTLKIS